MIVTAVPGEETSSALALNQVLRSIGYSIGSATGATILAAHTAVGQTLPDNRGYSVGAWVAVGLCLVAAVAAWWLPASTSTPSAAEELLIEESTDAAIGGVIGFEPAEDVVSLEGDSYQTSGRAS